MRRLNCKVFVVTLAALLPDFFLATGKDCDKGAGWTTPESFV